MLSHYRHLQRQGSLSRIGAVFAPGAGGASLLAAMAVPPERLEAVAAIVSSHAGVNHNYEREHATNLWFVATGPDAAQVDQLLRSIEMDTGLPVQRLPMLRPYRIDTGFDLRASQSRSSGATHWAQTPLQAQDQPLAALAEQGLPLVERPYDLWAEQLQQPVEAVLHTLQRWLDERTVSRFGVVVRHHELGFTANAMTVFDVPESEVDACGEALARVPGVTLAYQRARTGGWPYNLYCMVHGRDRERAHHGRARRGPGRPRRTSPRPCCSRCDASSRPVHAASPRLPCPAPCPPTRRSAACSRPKTPD